MTSLPDSVKVAGDGRFSHASMRSRFNEEASTEARNHGARHPTALEKSAATMAEQNVLAVSVAGSTGASNTS